MIRTYARMTADELASALTHLEAETKAARAALEVASLPWDKKIWHVRADGTCLGDATIAALLATKTAATTETHAALLAAIRALVVPLRDGPEKPTADATAAAPAAATAAPADATAAAPAADATRNAARAILARLSGTLSSDSSVGYSPAKKESLRLYHAMALNSIENGEDAAVIKLDAARRDAQLEGWSKSLAATRLNAAERFGSAEAALAAANEYLTTTV